MVPWAFPAVDHNDIRVRTACTTSQHILIYLRKLRVWTGRRTATPTSTCLVPYQLGLASAMWMSVTILSLFTFRLLEKHFVSNIIAVFLHITHGVTQHWSRFQTSERTALSNLPQVFTTGGWVDCKDWIPRVTTDAMYAPYMHAGESHRAATAAWFWMQSLRFFRHRGLIWQWFWSSRKSSIRFQFFGQSVRPQPGHPPFSINFPMHDEHKTHGQLGQESPPGYASVRQIEQLISVLTYAGE